MNDDDSLMWAMGSVVVLMAIYTITRLLLPCRWGGYHDWEVVESQLLWNGGVRIEYQKKICLSCEKLHDDLTPFLRRREKQDRLKARRQAQANQIMERNHALFP